MIKNILFDWDGTLVDSLNLWFETLKNTYNNFGIEIGDPDIINLMFGNKRKSLKLPKIDWNFFMEECDKEVKIWMPSVLLNTQVKETLDALKNLSIKMAILTNSTKSTILPALVKLKLNDYFETIYGREDVLRPKPDAEIVIKALDELKIKKSETLVVGDTNNDVLSGKAAGVKTVFYLPQINQRFFDIKFANNIKASYIISDFSELIKIVGE